MELIHLEVQLQDQVDLEVVEMVLQDQEIMEMQVQQILDQVVVEVMEFLELQVELVDQVS